MKKHLALLSLISICTPLLAATMPLTNATQCACELKNANDHFLTCSIQPGSTNIFVGKINNNRFSATETLSPGDTKSVAISSHDQMPAIVYNTDNSSTQHDSINLAAYHSPYQLTMIHIPDPKIQIYYPIQSQCINPNTCTYLQSQPSCAYSNLEFNR
jgi:hypothetical protein